MSQPKILNKRQVGVDLDHYARIFITGCALSALLVIAIAIAVCQAICADISDKYELQIDGLTDQLNIIESVHQDVIDDLNARHAAEVQELNDTISALNTSIDILEKDMEVDFEILRRYWYVLKDVNDNSGLSLELIMFVDEKCKEWNVNPHWMWHIWQRETGWTTRIDNYEGSGARGLGQLMPGTGKNLYENVLKKGKYTHDLAYDPFINAELSICHIGRNLAIGNMTNALELYSGGGGQSYYTSVVNKGKTHGITLNDSNAHYPY